MSLEDAIARNRARQAAKRGACPTCKADPHDANGDTCVCRAGEHTPRRDDGMRAFTVNVAVIPTAVQIALGLAKPISVGDVIPTEKRTIYGTSLADAKRRAGIE